MPTEIMVALIGLGGSAIGRRVCVSETDRLPAGAAREESRQA